MGNYDKVTNTWTYSETDVDRAYVEGYEAAKYEAELEEESKIIERMVELDDARRDGYCDGYKNGKEDARKEFEDELERLKKEYYEKGYQAALEEHKKEEAVEFDEFDNRSEDNPYPTQRWCDNARFFGFFKNPFCKYRLTTSKIIVEKGFLIKRSDPIILYRVLRSSVSQKLWQRLFKIGDVELKTEKHLYILKNVKMPNAVNAVILKYMNLNRKDFNVRMTELVDTHVD